MERHAKVNKRSWVQDQQRFNAHLKVELGAKNFSKIEKRDIRVIHERLTKVGKWTIANQVLALVSIIFAKAIEWEYATDNPASGIKLNKEKSRDRFLQSDELSRFFESLAAEQSATMRDFFLLTPLTGARRVNVSAMRWAEVSLERAEWRIERTKNGDSQTVALSPEATKILTTRKLSASSSYVFPAKRKSGYLTEPKDAWRRILDRDELTQRAKQIGSTGLPFDVDPTEPLARSLKRARELAKNLDINPDLARMRDLHIHDLRRTLGSWHAAAGASLSII